jgi:hypothetical protein
MTDYRAELQRLVKAYDEHGGRWPDHHVQALHNAVEAARTTLAQPEPQGPTQAELKTFACKWWHSFGFVKNKATCTWVLDQIAPEHFVDFSRDLLARWGRPTIEPVPGAKGE